MSYQEKRLVRGFAAIKNPSKNWITLMDRIYRENLSEYRRLPSLEMRFLSEVFSACPDLMLRSKYREDLVEKYSKIK